MMLPPVNDVAPRSRAASPLMRVMPSAVSSWSSSRFPGHYRWRGVAAEDVVEVPAGEGLDPVHAVTVGLDRRQCRDRELHVGVAGRRVAAMAHPVEAEHAFRPLDASAEEHDVVATFGVEVLLAAVAVHDVVSGFIGVVLERGAVVALQQVERSEAAFDPVVTIVTEDVSSASPAKTKSLPAPAKVSVMSLPPTMKSLPRPPWLRSPPKPWPDDR